MRGNNAFTAAALLFCCMFCDHLTITSFFVVIFNVLCLLKQWWAS